MGVLREVDSGLTITVVSLISYFARAGAVGGGGLGDIGIRYGSHRLLPEVMIAVIAVIAVIVVLIVLVQAVQSSGDLVARRLNKRVKG